MNEKLDSIIERLIELRDLETVDYDHIREIVRQEVEGKIERATNPFAVFASNLIPGEVAIDHVATQEELAEIFAPEISMDFLECDTCRAKPGSPRLCAGCLHNRTLIGRLKEASKRMPVALSELVDVSERLKYIANSPAREHGGFHHEAIVTAKKALDVIHKFYERFYKAK